MSGKKNAVYSQVKQLGVLTTIPIILLIGPVIGLFIGKWIDHKAHSYPWFTILFVFLGFFAAGREIARILQMVQKEYNQNKEEKK